MSDRQQQQPGQDGQPFFGIQRIYLKDLSLEQPSPSHIFLERGQPPMEIQVDVVASQSAEGVFEITVIGTATTRVQEKVASLAEAEQAGIFDIRNVPTERMNPLLDTACPTIVYLYLRSSIADTIGRAGFQPTHLAGINFQALYEQRLVTAMEQQGQAGGTGLIMPGGSKATH